MAFRAAIVISCLFVGFSHEFNGGCGLSDWRPHGSTIFNGEEVPPIKYPWQVYLYTVSGGFCGGAVISNFHILTAAHCLVNVVGDLKIVLGADTLYESESNYVKASKYKIYPGYQKSRGYVNTSDIGIVTLPYSIPFNSTIRPICLPVDASDLFIGRNATIAGWGTQTMASNASVSNKLMEANVEVISNQQCSWQFIKKYK